MQSLSYFQSIFLIFLFVLVHGAYNLDYSDLEVLGVACPERDKCAGHRFNGSYIDRNCECDSACSTYKDCCIDVNRKWSSGREVMPSDHLCLHYGNDNHTGVYVVAQCSSNWNGPLKVRQKCEGDPDMSDPVSAAPVTNVAQALTYKNLFCAECNNANMQSLLTFQFRVSCEGLQGLSYAQIMGDLFYNRQRTSWGINRLYSNGTTDFVNCDVIFDLPDYINASVRLCRANVISECASDWNRSVVRAKCEEYMAVVYDDVKAYRNPHCAICNHKTVANISCKAFLTGRQRPESSTVLLDVNQSDVDSGGMTVVTLLRGVDTSECSSGHIYDPFFKRCRMLVCALPGREVVNDTCVRVGS